MRLDYLFGYTAELDKPLHIGQGNAGVRDIFRICGGKVRGPELNGKLLPVGGEFQLTDSEGCFHIDVRLVIETGDDALIYMQYNGIADLSSVSQTLRTQGHTDFGDSYFVTRPILESGHKRYNWLNRIVCVAEGRIASLSSVEYHVYRCQPTPGD